MRPQADTWAALRRKLFSSPGWRGQSLPAKAVIVWIIGAARHQPNQYPPHTPAGSIDTRLDDIADACEVSRTAVKKALVELHEAGVILTETSSRGVRITVVNWREWIVPPRQMEQPATSRPAAERGTSHLATVYQSPGDPLSLTEEEKVPPTEVTRSRPPRERFTGDLFAEQIPADPTPADPTPIGHREVVAEFDRLYRGANQGAAPTWGKRQGGQIKALLAAHDGVEIIRRMTILFTTPPAWPPPPYTLDTLVKHFDALATPTVRPASGQSYGYRGMTPEQILDWGDGK